jgi:class 3 adenylate cyclase
MAEVNVTASATAAAAVGSRLPRLVEPMLDPNEPAPAASAEAEPPSPRRLTLLERLARAAVSDDDSDELRLRKTLLVFSSGLMNIAAILWLGLYWMLGQKLPTTIPLAYQLLSSLILVVYLKTRNFDFFRFAQLSLFLFAPFVIQWSIGSFVNSSGIMLLALLAPVGAIVVYGARESIPWFAAYVVLTALSGAFDYYLVDGDAAGMSMKTVAVFFVLNFTILSSIVYLLLRYVLQQKEAFQSQLSQQLELVQTFQLELSRQHELVQAEQRKSEHLLSNVLPPHIAERLKQDQSTIADSFADVTVMFADIVDFTGMTEQLTPKEVVALLDDVFTRFDDLAEKHGVDKIKTIGDAYMVAGGLTGDGTHYADAVADMALEMLALTRSDEKLRLYNVQFHIGIATGPVIAGVIGARRFVYDLWGDTVNIASRITAEAPEGGVMVDRLTYRRLATRFNFTEAQELMFKGKGKMTVYCLQGRRAALRTVVG